MQYLPLTAFVIVAQLCGQDSPAWPQAFRVGAILAVAETLLLISRRRILNRLLLGVNLFLVLGGIGFGFEWMPILDGYWELREATLPACILAVGMVTTVLSSRGFIEINSPHRLRVIAYSVALLGIAALCFAVSLKFRGNLLLSGALPVLILIVARKGLRRRF